jgi:hypothetical protein
VTAGARFIAVILGVVGLVVGMAALVRLAVLAAEPGITWERPTWWTDLTANPSTATTVAAAVTAVVAVALIILAIRQLRPGSRKRAVIEFGGADGQARLDVRALENALQRSLRSSVDGLAGCRAFLSREQAGWFVRVEAALPARDLLGVQERMTALLRSDLDRLGGVRLEGVDLVVAHVIEPAKKAAAVASKPGMGATGAS